MPLFEHDPNNLMFLDAQIKRDVYRTTIFGKTVEELLVEYQSWVKEGGWTQKNIWYANIFECGTGRHLGYVKIGAAAELQVFPVKNSKLSPYRRSLKQLISWFF